MAAAPTPTKAPQRRRSAAVEHGFGLICCATCNSRTNGNFQREERGYAVACPICQTWQPGYVARAYTRHWSKH